MSRTTTKGSAARRFRVADLVHSSSLRLLRLLRLQDKASGIGPAQLSALSVLVFAGPCSLKELAAREQVKPPTMSRIVAGLTRARLVHRKPARDDQRRAILMPTNAGLRIMLTGRKRRVAFLAKKLLSLSPTELQTLEAAARSILLILGAPRR